MCVDLAIINSFFSFSLLSEGEKLENKMKKLETQYNSLQVLSTITKLGTKEVRSSINVLCYTREKLFLFVLYPLLGLSRSTSPTITISHDWEVFVSWLQNPLLGLSRNSFLTIIITKQGCCVAATSRLRDICLLITEFTVNGFLLTANSQRSRRRSVDKREAVLRTVHLWGGTQEDKNVLGPWHVERAAAC